MSIFEIIKNVSFHKLIVFLFKIKLGKAVSQTRRRFKVLFVRVQRDCFK